MPYKFNRRTFIFALESNVSRIHCIHKTRLRDLLCLTYLNGGHSYLPWSQMLVTYTVYVKSGFEVCYALHILLEDIHICLVGQS